MQITKRAKIIWGVLLALVIALSGLLWWMQSPPPPALPAPRETPVKKSPAPEKASKQEMPPEADIPSLTPITATAGNLGKLSELTALEKELAIEVKIAKLRKEMEELSRSPAISAASLSLPAFTPPAPQPASVSRPTSASRGGLSVISIQGVEGQLTATIRTASGQTTARAGTRLGDAVVTGISIQGVMVRRGGHVSTLPFE